MQLNFWTGVVNGVMRQRGKGKGAKESINMFACAGSSERENKVIHLIAVTWVPGVKGYRFSQRGRLFSVYGVKE